MKKAVLLLLLSFRAFFLPAQNALTITSGTGLYISPSNILSVEGLSLTPSAGFSLNGVAVAKNTGTSHSGLSTTVLRTYLFSSITAPFSGTIRFYYRDAELNSLNESSLLIQTHTGTGWQTAGATTRDASANYVEVAGITNRSLAELTLNSNSLLPLSWKNLSAHRVQNTILVQWSTAHEVNLSHFSVERSLNNEAWQTIATNIKPNNSSFDQQYAYTDANYITGKAIYRIRQTDLNGRYTYSPVAVALGLSEHSTAFLYPNPVLSTFTLVLSRPANTKEIRLYHSSGMQVAGWQTPPTRYDINGLPAGVYQLSIVEKDGNKQCISLIKN